MKLLFTGCTSFTGFHFINELAKLNEFEIHAITTKNMHEYSDQKLERLKLLDKKVKIHHNIQFGDESFIELLNSPQSQFEILCCHGAYVENYNSDKFDLLKSIEINTKNLSSTLEVFKNNGGRILINTGSIFEPNEGLGDEQLDAFNLYGLSKNFTNELFKYYSKLYNLSFGKFVIPNPFGFLEEPRFTNYLFKCWKNYEVPVVKTPKYIRDNVPVNLLSLSYANFILQICNRIKNNHISQIHKCNPSGYVESQGDFALRLIKNIEKYFNLTYKVELYDQIIFDQPVKRFNDYKLFENFPNWNEEQFWIEYLNFYLK